MKTYLNTKQKIASFAILFAGLLITAVSTYLSQQHIESDNISEYNLICNEIASKIDSRFHAHAQLLSSGAGFFYSSDTVLRSEWKDFVTHSRIDKNLPGIQGYGFSLIIPKNQLDHHIKRFQKDGFPNYVVKPVSDRPIYTSIIYLEPFNFRNQRAFGYDMFSEPTRRKAMEQARDLDIASLSGKVLLVQETDSDLQAGTLMYVPVYNKNMPTNTVEERRKAIKGWVYSPYRMDDLMDGILGRWDDDNEARIHLEVYDDSISDNSALFNSQVKDSVKNLNLKCRTLIIPIEFNGKKLVLNFKQPKASYPYFASNNLIVAISGLSISLLFFFVIVLMLSLNNRARNLAIKLTSDLIESKEELLKSNQQLSNIIDGSRVGTWEWNVQTGETKFNNYWAEIIGYNLAELEPVSIKTWQKYAHPDDLKISNDLLDKYFRGEANYYLFESRMKHKNGSWVWVLDRGKVFEWTDDGKPLMMYGTHQDITERKKDEKALLEKSKKLNQLSKELEIIIDNIPGLVFYKDANNHFIRVNKFMCEAHKLEKEQLEGKSLFDIYPKETAQAYYDDDLQVIQSKQAKLNIEEPWETGSETRWISTSKIPYFDESGEIIGVIGVSIDITEKRKLQGDFIRAFIDAQEHEKQIFGADIHDGISQILSAEAMYIDVLLKLCDKGADSKIYEYLHKIRDFNIKAITDARNIAYSLTSKQLNEGGLIKAIEYLCIDYTATRNINFNFSCTDLVESDFKKEIKVNIFRIVQEVTMNTIHHSLAKNASIDMYKINLDTIKLVINDDGVGIDFEKIKNNNNDAGIKYIKHRVSFMNGDIQIISAPNKGTCYTIFIPLDTKMKYFE